MLPEWIALLFSFMDGESFSISWMLLSGPPAMAIVFELFRFWKIIRQTIIFLDVNCKKSGFLLASPA